MTKFGVQAPLMELLSVSPSVDLSRHLPGPFAARMLARDNEDVRERLEAFRATQERKAAESELS